MSGQDGGESVGCAGPYSIARVESKLASIQERIALLQASLNDCRSPEQRQYLQAELAFVKTRQMVCQKHKGMLIQTVQPFKHTTESRPSYSYSDYLISGALKLFHRWNLSSSVTESAGAGTPDQESPLLAGTDMVEGQQSSSQQEDPILTDHRPTLRKRKLSNMTS